MRVQIDHREFWIEFRYEDVVVTAASREARESTTCLIRDGSAPRDRSTGAPVVASAEVIRYYKDPPNREVARKMALAKVLEEFNRSQWGPEPVTEEVRAADKARRTLFWMVYLNRNAEGQRQWSGRGTGKTSAAGARNSS